jgi:energy-coupling factor transport system ATP-binding protein
MRCVISLIRIANKAGSGSVSVSKTIIRLKDYSYQYPSTSEPTLKNITLDIEEGDFIGVVGCNRSGKSTFCKSLVGILPFVFGGEWGGEIIVDGKSINETRGSGVTDVVGIVFQDAESQFTQQTVEDEIAFAMCNFGYERGLMRERVKFAAEACNLYSLLDRSPYRLSGGQQQRLAVACILALQPRVIILDEATSQLDPIGRDEIFKLVTGLHKEGKTIIMVDHNIEQIAGAVNKVLVLHEGNSVIYGDVRGVFEDKALLNKHFVRVPQVTDAAYALRDQLPPDVSLPIKLDEAAKAMSGLNRSMGGADA